MPEDNDSLFKKSALRTIAMERDAVNELIAHIDQSFDRRQLLSLIFTVAVPSTSTMSKVLDLSLRQFR